MRHGDDGEMASAWMRDQRQPERPSAGEARLARFDATQDVILAAAPFADRLTMSEHDANAERLADACRRYLMTHAVVKATTP